MQGLFTCQDRGCCWSVSDIAGEPWCFHGDLGNTDFGEGDEGTVTTFTTVTTKESNNFIETTEILETIDLTEPETTIENDVSTTILAVFLEKFRNYTCKFFEICEIPIFTRNFANFFEIFSFFTKFSQFFV